jgi:hypothetical protein
MRIRMTFHLALTFDLKFWPLLSTMVGLEEGGAPLHLIPVFSLQFEKTGVDALLSIAIGKQKLIISSFYI